MRVNIKASTVDWWGKNCLGLVMGFLLALALSSLFAWLGPGGIDTPHKVQFNMWVMPPIMMVCWSLVYLFRSAAQAFFWLGGINGVLYGVLLCCRMLMESQV
ncbi:hypothetical protein [Teredinibacter purpureus]|jgi:hypothetical protein|uniref:hypothetical protein n=1 Tax=Teredinibacter purpureus TaxID=2731756 RepID=UPI0005F775B1|nr:hypothetical protein [Teredinibacter purpureus]